MTSPSTTSLSPPQRADSLSALRGKPYPATGLAPQQALLFLHSPPLLVRGLTLENMQGCSRSGHPCLMFLAHQDPTCLPSLLACFP